MQVNASLVCERKPCDSALGDTRKTTGTAASRRGWPRATGSRLRCATGNPGELRISGNEFNKYGYFREPLRDGLFSHRFENQFESPQTAPLKGEVKGNVKRRSKKGKPQINGSFHVDDWDPAPGIADCTSVGWYSATPCKRWISPKAPKYDSWKKRKLPVCKQTW